MTPLRFEGRLAEIRVVAEAFGTMDILERIKAMWDGLKTHDPSITAKYDPTSEALSVFRKNKVILKCCDDKSYVILYP